MKDFIHNFKAQSVAARVMICLVCVALCMGLLATAVGAWYSVVIGSGSNLLLVDNWTTGETTETSGETTDSASLLDNMEASEGETTEAAAAETTEAVVPETTVVTVDDTVSE